LLSSSLTFLFPLLSKQTLGFSRGSPRVITSPVRALFIGDVFGKPGRVLVANHLPTIRSKFDFVIANAENSAGGFGMNRESLETLTKAGVNAVTMGNHVWDNKEIFGLLDDPRVIRPLNFPLGTPGRGWGTFTVGSEKITVVNILGRLYMNLYEEPFAALEGVLEHPDLGAVFVDFHAEATSEKICFAASFDGRVAAVIGTHTHVPTADTRLLPLGTAFQSDSGMTGPLHSSIGMSLEGAIGKFRTGLPHKTNVAEGPCVLNAVELDITDGIVTRIARYSFFENDSAGKLEGEVKNA
jgi:2',3'-cyclic-nucleotide 2'-phosphodiesterase / phosphoenolpyruvate phosphatase